MNTKKVALVTGASRGIGKEVAITLANDGFFVIVNYCGSKEAAEQVVETIIQNGNEAEAYQCNVASYEDVKVMMDYIISTHGGLDVVVNNAGITRDNLLLKMSEEEFDVVLQTNLKGVFNTAKHAIRTMIKKRSGHIINISSVSGIMGNAGQCNYSAAKAGIIGFTKSLAREVASRNITVNAVAPGFIKTDMTDDLPEQVAASVMEQIPLKQFGSTADIANAVAYLASEKAGYITGQVLQVDGGLAM